MYCQNCGKRIEIDDRLNAANGCVFCRGQPEKTSIDLFQERDNYEKQLIEAALERNEYNVTKAAADLGVGRTTLLYKVKRYDLLHGSSNAIRYYDGNFDGPIQW